MANKSAKHANEQETRQETKMMFCGLELVGIHAELMQLASKYKIMGVPVDASYTDVLFEEFKYIPVEMISLEGSKSRDLKSTLFPGHPCSFSSNEIKYGERFTITPIKDIAPLYYLFNYVTKEEEHKALQLKGIKDFALKLKYEKEFFWRNLLNYELMEMPEMSPISAATFFQETNDRLIIKKAIGTFAKVGDLLVDEVEVGLPGPIPYGSVDMMVVSYLEKIPPVCLFNVGDHTFYHCMSASFKTTSTFGLEASERQAIAELLSVYENLNCKEACETIVMIKANRFKFQPYIYVASHDILLRVKEPVVYRRENGKPDALGCLLLYFMLRQDWMLSKENIMISCDAVARNVRCGWKKAVDSVKNVEYRIRLQKLVVPKNQFPDKKMKNEDMKKIQEKFGLLCRSIVEREENS